MSADQKFSNVAAFAIHLQKLRAGRKARVLSVTAAGKHRGRLTSGERALIFQKAGGRCHICGGPIDAQDWEADHVFAHSAGGTHSIENYLPAHSLCNNYRWHYDTEEFQWILKLGVWLHHQIETRKPLGLKAGSKFVVYDRHRASRRKPQRQKEPIVAFPQENTGSKVSYLR